MDDSELQTEELTQRLAKSVAPAPAIFLNAQFESELTELDEADAREMLEDAGLDESGLDQLARVGFDILGLQTFLTAGEKEVRAWQIHKGWTAPQAAGVIHTDFEKGFIKAEVVSYDDFVEAYGSMAKIKEEGKLRLEGKDYVMQDGDEGLGRRRQCRMTREGHAALCSFTLGSSVDGIGCACSSDHREHHHRRLKCLHRVRQSGRQIDEVAGGHLAFVVAAVDEQASTEHLYERRHGGRVFAQFLPRIEGE